MEDLHEWGPVGRYGPDKEQVIKFLPHSILTAQLSFYTASLIVGQKPVHYKGYRDSKLVSLLVYHFFAQQRS